jgi:hypothetical protein
MSNQLSRFNRVRYFIYGKPFDSLLIQEPKGWESDQKELLRSEKYEGIFYVLSNNLMFYKDAKDALQSAYDIFGIKADIRIERESRNENTDVWEIDYVGYLDFKTYKKNKNFISLKVNESKFFQNIEARFNEQFELERLTDLKNNPIPVLPYDVVSFEGREIFRETVFTIGREEGKPQNYYCQIGAISSGSVAIPMDLTTRSDANAFAPAIDTTIQGDFSNESAVVNNQTTSISNFRTNQLFYLTAEESITYKIKVKFKATVRETSQIVAPNKVFRIDRCEFDDSNITYKWNTIESFVLGSITVSNNNVDYILNVDTEIDVDLLEGESLVFFMYNNTNPSQGGRVFLTVEDLEIKMETVDASRTTITNGITVNRAFQRLFRIITGIDTYASDLLTIGTWADLLITNGFKIRNIPDKNITISLKDLYEAMNTIDDIAIVIENNTVRVENKAFVYRNIVGFELGQVSEVERIIDEKAHFSAIEIGYDFNGEYEEVNGLDEFNIKNRYSTCIDTVENELKAVSKVRADAYGMTLAQQKQYEDNLKLDTKYDKFNYFLDCKLNNVGIYELRKWQDDFEDEPTGIFSPASAFNLRLSPFNCLLRKSKTISSGLQKFPTELLIYSSTEGNSQLVTLYPERAEIPNSELPVPFYLPEEIEFTRKISMIQFRQLVQNKYNLVKFVNEEGDEEYGFILNVKPNKEGKFKLIKANF